MNSYSIKDAFKALDLVESVDSDKYFIKYWANEELRDMGESDVYFNNLETLDQAVNEAKKMIDNCYAASVEVFKVGCEDDCEPLFGTDGVEIWGTELSKVESVEIKSSKKLLEATSNFGKGPKNFPLYVFVMEDELDDTEYESTKLCIFGENDVLDLQSELDNFNDETKDIAYSLESEDSETSWSDCDSLKDIKLEIESGYYNGAYIAVRNESNFDDLSDGVREAQLKRFGDFLKSMKNVFGLSTLKAGPAASNGERAYELTESKKLTEEKFDITDEKEVVKAKEMLDDKEEEEHIEMIIDVDAETPEDLKQSYVGSAALECPVCHTLVYKKIEDVVADETRKGIVNVGEKCPRCKSDDGFKLIGKLAPLSTDVNGEEPEETSPGEEIPLKSNDAEDINDEETPDADKNEIPEVEDEDNKSVNLSRMNVGESLVQEEDVSITDVDETLFNTIVEKYLHTVYDNIESYKTISGTIDDKENKVVLEGIINFKSKKTMKTKFMLEAKGINKRGKIKFVGLNETFSKSNNAFSVIASVENKKLMCESLAYNYDVADKKISGKVTNSYKKR